jgi:microcystin-dependent protein
VSEPFIGEIRAFGFNFAPRGWATCSGQILSIAQNTALYSLLGTTYCGNGQTTFALPDLRGRVAVNQGQGPGLSNKTIGEQAGAEAHTLNVNEIPAHTHAQPASNADQSTNRPGNAVPTRGGVYAGSGDGTLMDPMTAAGGSQPHDNMQPYLTVNYCIALVGIFPSRN